MEEDEMGIGKELRARARDKEAEGELALKALKGRIKGLTLRTRQMEVRPNLQFFVNLPR